MPHNYFERLESKWARQSMTKHVDVMAARGKARAHLVMRYTSKSRLLNLMERIQKQIASGDAGWIGSLHSVLQMMHTGLSKAMHETHPRTLKHHAEFDVSAHTTSPKLPKGEHETTHKDFTAKHVPHPPSHTHAFEATKVRPGKAAEDIHHTRTGSTQRVAPHRAHVETTKKTPSTIHTRKMEYVKSDLERFMGAKESGLSKFMSAQHNTEQIRSLSHAEQVLAKHPSWEHLLMAKEQSPGYQHPIGNSESHQHLGTLAKHLLQPIPDEASHKDLSSVVKFKTDFTRAMTKGTKINPEVLTHTRSFMENPSKDLQKIFHTPAMRLSVALSAFAHLRDNTTANSDQMIKDWVSHVTEALGNHQEDERPGFYAEGESGRRNITAHVASVLHNHMKRIVDTNLKYVPLTREQEQVSNGL